MADRAGAYQVVARRFRPKTFDEVVGQDAVVRSLELALTSDRVPHAFLFAGSRGVGKTTLARILARALNCETGPRVDPCGTCRFCVGILDGSDADVIEIDAASHNLVDDIRELRERVSYASMGARFKVYILDEVHMLTRSAFNAFLKTLEEPPAGVVFVLATTELHKVPETIRSRCQVLMFRRVGERDIVERLARICQHEAVTLSTEILRDVAASSRGGMRDAETLLERILPAAREAADTFDLAAYRALVHRVGIDRVVEVVEALLRGDAGPGLHFAAAVVDGGVDEREALGEILEVLRAILLLRIDGEASPLVAHVGELRTRLVTAAATTELERLDAMIHAGLLGRERIRRLDDRRLVLEVSLLRMASAGQLPALGDLVAALASGTPSVPADESPVPVPAPAAPSSAGPGAVGDLRSALLAAVREQKPMLAATIEECDVEGPDPRGVVTLALRSDRRMHRDRLASPPLQDLLRGLVRGIVGADIRLAVRVSAGPTEAAPIDERSARPRPGPLVQKIIDRFDGQVLDSDDD